MNHLKVVGEYLGREVRTGELATLDRLALDQLRDSVVLVLFGNDHVPDEKNVEFLKSLITPQPLAITVFGVGAKKAFDSLIALLGDGQERKHTMTKLFEEDRIEYAIEDLLQSTWPSEDRFDEWKGYVILSNGKFVSTVEETISKLCH